MTNQPTWLVGAIAVAATLAPQITHAACDPGEELIRFSHVTAESGHPKGEAATLLANRINTELDGRACMEVYPRSSLFNDDDVLDAMLRGDVEMAAPSLSKFEAYTLAFRIFDLPFLFEDILAVEEFQASPQGQEMLLAMSDQGLLGLGFWHNGMKQISANVPLERPSDAEGLMFRIQPSAVIAAQIAALGAESQAMPFSQVFDALESGQVDAQQNTWSNIYTQGFYLVQDGITETNHGIIDYLVVTSSDWWQGLDDGLRAELEQIILEVTHERNRFAFELGELARMRVRQDGGVIRRLDDAAREEWVAAFAPVWDQFRDEIGSDLIAAAQAAEGGI
ncbi:DctP family TRAP transporter solute-binding subunit [Pontivivens insulae]|uniref:C4-dicarboxylate-binding periplasmic protein DctP n=1 Tax=Pontivivens insulae TaxID=1639689 RepID=A0A2R8A8M9_9RHOB|nr:DctP family TRAP transporter solute-binding subunit [Pontivivens insulae]RED18512.1 C4-dicarboxylate-binding protein DctP [Pontivivens insulae]SPF28410.1 C4-dicarboxylate-binding periplasmic protein DctP [Pontivivens insulae]